MTALASHSQSSRSAEVMDLVEQLTARIQSGEHVDLDAFLVEHAEHADEIRRLLPALALLVDLSRSATTGQVVPGQAVLGELGDFQIIREVGRGGMGVVYEATQISLNRRVALKVLPFAATMDPRHLQRFRHEAQAAAMLHHPNIVPVHGVGCERGVHYYAMQLISGRSLADVVNEQRSLNGRLTNKSTAEYGAKKQPSSNSPTVNVVAVTTVKSQRGKDHFVSLARQIAHAADALEYAHSMGVVHRDIKPGNLLLDDNGHLWVTDFGLAKLETNASMTMTGDLIGTLKYMSPEQALARHGLVDHRTDVYSLGATLYELLTLKPAVDGADKQEILKKIAFEEPVALRKLDKSIPAELETITLKCLAKEPAERYSTAKQLGDDLRYWLEDKPIKAKPPGLLDRAVKWVRRHSVGALAAGVILLVVTAAAATCAALVYQEKRMTDAALSDVRKAYDRVRLALDDMTSQVVDEWLAMQGNPQPHHRDFLKRAVDHYEWLAAQPAANADTRASVAAAYLRAGDIHQKLGHLVDAEAAYLRSIAAYQMLTGDQDGSQFGQLLAKAHRACGVVRHRVGRHHDAEKSFHQALKLQNRVVNDSPDQVEHRFELAGTLLVYGDLVAKIGRRDKAEEIFSFGLKLMNETVAPADKVSAYDHQRGQLSIRHGSAWYSLRQFAKAEVLHRQGINLLEGLVKSAGSSFQNVLYREDLADGLTALGHDLGLGCLQRAAEAVEADKKAVAIREQLAAEFPAVPEYRHRLAKSLHGLGNHFCDLDQFAEAEPNYRRQIEILEKLVTDFPNEPEFQDSHGEAACALAVRYVIAKRPTDSELLFNKALEVLTRLAKTHPDRFQTQMHLGYLFSCRDQEANALDCYKRAVNLAPFDVDALDTVGYFLARGGYHDQAEAAFRRATNLMPDNPVYHDHLGAILQVLGRFEESLEAYRKRHELSGGTSESKEMVQELERQIQLVGKLQSVLDGKEPSMSPMERLELTDVCKNKQMFAGMAQLYSEAFAADPKLAHPEGPHIFNAVRAAALAGLGAGQEAAKLDVATKSRWRRQALEWLEAYLAALVRRAEVPASRPDVHVALQGLFRNGDIEGLRSADELAKLPSAERDAWQKFWKEANELSNRTKEPTTPEKTNRSP